MLLSPILERDPGGYIVSESMLNIIDTNVCGRIQTGVVCLGYPGEIRVGKNHKLVHERQSCDLKYTVGATMIGMTCGPAFVAGKCVCNVINAFCNRHLKECPPPKRALSLEFYSEYLERIITEYGPKHEYWLRMWIMKWPVKRRKAILEAFDKSPDKPGFVKAFLKREVMPKRITKARLIQGYFELITQEASGPGITALQKAMCDVINKADPVDGIDIAIASGMNANDLGKWMTLRKHLKFYERDASNYDATITTPMQQSKCDLFSKVDPDLAEQVRKSINVTGLINTPQHTIRYQVQGTTKSGHNDTSLGNTIINVAIARAAMIELGITGSIIAMGDDLLVAVNEDFDAQQFANIEKEYGIDPKAARIDDWRYVSFLSGVWYPDGHDCFFGPRITSILDKLFWTVNPPSKEKYDSLFRNGIVLSMLRIMNNMPIVRKFLHRHYNPKEGFIIPNEMKYKYEHHFKWSGECPGSYLELQAHLTEIYGIMPSEILYLETLFENLPIYSAIRNDTIDTIREIEKADPDERAIHAQTIG